MNRIFICIILVLLGGNLSASELLKNEGVVVSVEDVERYIEFNVPLEQREALVQNERKLRELIESIYVLRKLSALGESQGEVITKSFEWKLELDKARSIAMRYLSEEIGRREQMVDWSARAYEYYLVNKSEFLKEDQVVVSHVLVSTEERSDEQALALAKDVRRRVDLGESINEMARSISDDRSAKKNSGRIGPFGRHEMVAEFERASFSMLKSGEVSGPVRTKFGYHVIKLEELKAGGIRDFSDVKKDIINKLRVKYKDDERARVIVPLKTTALSNINLSSFAAFQEKMLQKLDAN